MSFVADLEPRALWSHFDRILTIPRASKHEDAMRGYVLGIAERQGLATRQDAAGNVVVRKPASPGAAGAPTVVLQSHLDMVQEKNADVSHDFARDPIRPRRAGEWLYATGTTLGADNGIGVAALLAVLEARDLAHGPLELLFTIDEETGLTGAMQLDPELVEGRILLNLDSEEEGVLTIGCAGGSNTTLRLPVSRAAVPAGSMALSVALGGLKGGHSGLDIHLQRGNAIQLLARAVHAARPAQPLRLSSIHGGNKHNAIPREAWATVVVPRDAVAAVRGTLEAELAAIAREYRVAEPDLRPAIDDAPAPADAWDDSTSDRALGLLVALPHGVIALSLDIPGLVETSTNLAIAAERDGALSILLASRSSVASALVALKRRIRAAAWLADAAVDEHPGYPAWQPDPSSRIVGLVQRMHERVYGRAAKLGAVHAGLECGIIGEKNPGTDMVSFGPQIEHPHSPDERVKIDTVGRFYELLGAVLQELARGSAT